jgi:hypothetical protein
MIQNLVHGLVPECENLGEVGSNQPAGDNFAETPER